MLDVPAETFSVRSGAARGNCPPAALWSLDDTFAKPDLLVLLGTDNQAQTIRRSSGRNDLQLYEVEPKGGGRLVLTGRDTTWCGTAVDRWELTPTKTGYGGTRSLQLRVPPRCERLCTATLSTLVGTLLDPPAPGPVPARFAGWTRPDSDGAPAALPLPVIRQTAPVRFERGPGESLGYLVLGSVAGTWGLVSASPRWLERNTGKTRSDLTLEKIGAGRLVRTLEGRNGQVRSLALQTVPSSWTDNASMTGYDVALAAREPVDIAVVAGVDSVTWEPVVSRPATLSEADVAAIEVELAWTSTLDDAEGRRVFPEIVPLHLGLSGDGTRWLVVRQGEEPAAQGWLGLSLLRGAKDGSWSRWARFDILVTDAVPVAVLETREGPAVISVGSCRNSEYPAYAVSTSAYTDELALDCGV